MKRNTFYVYILTNSYNELLYTGVTNDLERRCHEHKSKRLRSFTQKYNIGKLFYYEVFDSIIEAIKREKQIKGLLREKKLKMINDFNKEWKDLASLLRNV